MLFINIEFMIGYFFVEESVCWMGVGMILVDVM